MQWMGDPTFFRLQKELYTFCIDSLFSPFQNQQFKCKLIKNIFYYTLVSTVPNFWKRQLQITAELYAESRTDFFFL